MVLLYVILAGGREVGEGPDDGRIEVKELPLEVWIGLLEVVC